MSGYADPDAIGEHIAEVIPLATRLAPREREPGEDEDAQEQFAAGVTEPPEADSREVPPHLLDVPGLVGHITRWIVKTSLYPQPVLALGAALSLVGTAASRKYAGPTKSGTHLYVLGLAETGAGKNHPAKLGKRLLRAANMEELIGPGQFMSEPAVYQTISKNPTLLCFMDEFGSYLGRINSPKGASGYEKAISGALRIFWGASFDTIHPPAWASSSSREVLKPIHSPALSIYGMSVHEEFYQALQSADIANGFLNRFLILSTHHKPDEVEPELDDDLVPPQLVDWLQRIAVTSPRRSIMPEVGWAAEVRVDFETKEARVFYNDFRKSLVTTTTDDAKLLSRVPEMAVRLATIRAIGRTKGEAPPRVDITDMQWGCELAMWSAQGMIADSLSYMVESEHQGRTMEVLRHIKAAPRRRITLTDLYRKVKFKYDARQLRLILDGLAEGDQIEIVRTRVEGAKKPTDTIHFLGK